MTFPLEVLTNSVLAKKRRCEELFRLSTLERLEKPTTRPARPVGSAFHKGIELRSPQAGSDHLRAAAGDVLWLESERESLETWCSIVEAMVAGALAFWSHPDDWPTVQERAFEVPLVNPETGFASTRHRFGGRIDGEWQGIPPHIVRRHPELPKHFAIWHHPDGTPSPRGILELKTAGRLDSDYIRRLHIAAQPTAYLEASSYGLDADVRCAVYRIAKKPGIRPHKGETDFEYRERCAARKPLAPLKQRKTETDDNYLARSIEREASRPPPTRKIPEPAEAYRERVLADYLERPENYFAEVLVTRTEEQLVRWRYEAWEEHLRILAIENGGMTIRNDHACLDFGRCDFFDLCTGQVGVDAFNVRSVTNPELENE